MTYSISKIASILNVKNKPVNEAVISVLLTDSRKLTNPAETLFFAMVTKSNDAHNFVSDLYLSGVRNFVVSKMRSEWQVYNDANFLLVKDSLLALQKLASYHRSQFDIPVIGITGSNGKTIVKEWLYQLLEENYNIVRSPRSFNSQIGVPLSVWQLNESTEFGIFEAGISKPDEMERLEPVIQPTIGILTNIGEAHQENFSSLEQKYLEKMELFKNVNVCIYCQDNPLMQQCIDMMMLSQRSFSWSLHDEDAPLYISRIDKKDEFTEISYSFLKMDYSFKIGFTDNASIENAINCLSAMLLLHIYPDVIAQRMEKLEPVAMRLDVRQGKHNCIIINDTYNSDINSIQIALDFQNQRHTDKPLKKTVIISDILQSGIPPKTLYRQVADMLEHSNIDKLIGIGKDISASENLFQISEKIFFPTTENGMILTMN